MTNDIILKAILKINPSAEVSISENDINNIVWKNGTTPIPTTEIESKINNITSGKQKLLDLGLTEEEVKALIGV